MSGGVSDESLTEWQADLDHAGADFCFQHGLVARQRLLTLIAEVRELRAENEQLEQLLEDRDSLAFDLTKAEAEVQRLRERIEGLAGWRECTPPHQGVDVSYCPNCSEAKMIRTLLQPVHTTEEE